MTIKSHRPFVAVWLHCAIAGTALIALVGCISVWQMGANAVVSADQRGQSLMDQSEFTEAAKTFSDPFRQGVAFYRAGEFKDAAAVFGGLPTAEASFNQANALVMLGKYDDAVTQYDRSLELRPNWKSAITNRDIAAGRAKRMEAKGGDMTGGELGADDITFDKHAASSDQTETIDQEQGVDDQSLRAIWLRQVQTTPSQFLESKFAYQNAMEQAPTRNEPPEGSNDDQSRN